MIRVSGLHKTYRVGDDEVRALRGVDLAIGRNEMVAIMGSSGSGIHACRGQQAAAEEASAGPVSGGSLWHRLRPVG